MRAPDAEPRGVYVRCRRAPTESTLRAIDDPGASIEKTEGFCQLPGSLDGGAAPCDTTWDQ